MPIFLAFVNIKDFTFEVIFMIKSLNYVIPLGTKVLIFMIAEGLDRERPPLNAFTTKV